MGTRAVIAGVVMEVPDGLSREEIIAYERAALKAAGKKHPHDASESAKGDAK